MFNRTVQLIATGCLLAGLLLLSYAVLRFFVEPVAWAVIVSYVSWPLHGWIRRSVGQRDTIAALLTTMLLGSAILVPLIWVTILLQRELAELVRVLPEWLERKPALPGFVAAIPYLGSELQGMLDPFEDLQGLLKQHALPSLRRLGTPFLGLVSDIGHSGLVLLMTLFTLFFLFRDGLHLVLQIKQVFSQVLGERLKGYFETSEATVKAVVYGIVLTAVAQGSLAGLGYWAVGVTAPIMLGIVTAGFAMIPFGTPVVWVSTSIWLLLQGETWGGVALALWGTLVISWVDNIIRPLVISASTRIPFVLVMFGVLGGLASFGFIGLFLGPVILAIALAVWREWLQQHDGTAGSTNVANSAEP